MMSSLPVWTEQIRVRPFETDFQNLWKPTAVFQAFQDVANNHATNLGFDYRDMLADDRLWVLSRMKVYFYSFPTTGDMLTVRTWPKGIRQKIFFARDFQVMLADGTPVVAATSAWLLISPRSRRMLPPTALPGDLPDNAGLHAVDEDLEKLAPSNNLAEKFTAHGSYSAVDLVGHVNNARYIDWVLDCFPFEHFRQNRLAWLQINYSHEVRAGESVRVSAGARADDPARWLVVGEKAGSGEIAFEVETGWVSQ